MKPERYDLALTFKCNNNCPFCLLEDKHREKGIRNTKKLLNKIKIIRNECNEICFCGGEPLIHPDIIKIIQYAQNLKFNKIHIQTNARMLSNDEFCNTIVNVGATDFLVSLHASNEQIGEILSKAPKALSQTIKGIQNIKKHKKNLITNTVITTHNLEYLPEIIQQAINLQTNQIQLAIVRTQGKAIQNQEIVPKINQTTENIEKCIKIAQKNNKPILIEGIPFCKLSPKYHKYIAENHMPDTKLDIGVEARANIPRKIKFEKCKSCKYNNSCQGIWEKYPDIHGLDEFK